eukprot:gene6222-707_t
MLQIMNSLNDAADAEAQEGGGLGWYPGKSWMPKH